MQSRFVLVQFIIDFLAVHSSEIWGLRSTKCSSKMLQLLPYFMFLKKTQSCTKWVYYTLKKYIKFWSISLKHFVERKPLISLYLRFFRASFFKKGFLKTRYLDQLRGKINFLNRNLKCSGSLENCELIHYIHSCSWS